MKRPVSDPQHQQAIQLAISRLQTTVLGAIARASDSLGTAAVHAASNVERQALMNAQYDFNRRQSAFKATFTRVLRRKVDEGFHGAAPKADAPPTDWTALSLVSESEDEERLTAKQLGLDVGHACDWELRELAAFVARIQDRAAVDPDTNPLRPEVLGQALFRAIETVSDVPETRRALARHISRELARDMKGCYQQIIDDFRRRGLEPLEAAARPSASPPPAGGRGAGTTNRSASDPADIAAQLAALFGRSFDEGDGAPGSTGASGPGSPRAQASGFPAPGQPPQAIAPAPSLAPLIRQIAQAGSFPGATGTSDNLIWKHRPQLMAAASGSVDRSVIEAVGVLFEQVLTDATIQPGVARLIGGLQLPVLQAALKDADFFVAPDHPLRSFVNRLWALAASFDTLDQGAGRRFIEKANQWIDSIRPGDLDDSAAIGERMAALEAMACEPQDPEAADHRASMAALLQRKEAELRAQQRYVRTLELALSDAPLPDFLRSFIAQIWSQAIVLTAVRGTQEPIDHARCVEAMQDLVLSVQPMGTPQERSTFLVKLPALTRIVREGLSLIEWPAKAQDAFFAQLQPAQTAALRAPALDDARKARLAAALAALREARMPAPESEGGASTQAPGDVAPEPATPPEPIDPYMPSHFLPVEALTVGLLPDATRLAPPQAPPPELQAGADRLDEPGTGPVSGRALFDALRAGQMYRMQIEHGWQKMRLAMVSDGRAFFVFTHGNPERTITLTARMLLKLCELRRLRSVDRGDLVARAARRARTAR